MGQGTGFQVWSEAEEKNLRGRRNEKPGVKSNQKKAGKVQSEEQIVFI